MNERQQLVDPAPDDTALSRLFDLTGRTLGKYRLTEKLGQGGMAQVYRAYQADLDRYVAIKVLHPHLTGDEEFATRFRREARVVAALEHPNILRVYDVGTENGLAFLVMEYLQGTSLKAEWRDLDCRRERMELSRVGQIVAALADALDYAHRHGLVHRDVKPSNIILTNAGRTVLTDFGIARMVDATTITSSGGTLGTPAYMSPEQGRGEPGDARSDIYALGVVLYQLCTGRLPFDADTPYVVILKHMTAPLPPPRSVQPDLPRAVERVILKALAKDPNDRFQTAGEMAHALRAAIGDQAAPARTPRSRRALLWIAPLTLIAALAASSLFLKLWQPRRPPATPGTVQGTPGAALHHTGAGMIQDTWLNPDLPDETWQDSDLVHLQGPLTPDRLLLRFDLAALPTEATVVSATLTLRVELWGEQSFPGAAVVYRVLAPWEPSAATYNAPWSAPGLARGVDYDPTPLDVAPVPDAGQLALDITPALTAWLERGEPNHGLVIMMSEDSHNQSHYWVYMTEQPAPADRPAVHIAYKPSP